MCKCSEMIEKGFPEPLWDCPEHHRTGSLEAQQAIHDLSNAYNLSYNQAWDLVMKARDHDLLDQLKKYLNNE